MHSRDSSTQPERSNLCSSRVTISRTVPSSSARAWWVARSWLPWPSRVAARRLSSFWKATASIRAVRSAMRAANRPITKSRKGSLARAARKRAGGSMLSRVGRVVMPRAVNTWPANRQADDTRHISPGSTRYSSSSRPLLALRETRTSPSSTSGKPWQASCSRNRVVPSGTCITGRAGGGGALSVADCPVDGQAPHSAG